MKIKREIEKLFLKPIIESKNDMDKFKKKQMQKIRLIKNTWFEWLIDYIPEPIRKSVGGFKNNILNIVNISNRNVPKQTE